MSVERAPILTKERNPVWRRACLVYRVQRSEMWSRNFAQGVKWNSCLTAGTIEPANQERP